MYSEVLAATREEDFSDVESHRFLQLPCRDLAGQAVVLVVARYLPANIEDAERLYRYVIHTLDTVADDKYSVVYVHTDASYWDNSPGVAFLKQAYERCGALPPHLSAHL